MTSIERISQILAMIKPNKDMSAISDIVEGGYLDSFELMSLIAQISETFNIDIGIDDINPENFNSIQAIAKLVDRLTQN